MLMVGKLYILFCDSACALLVISDYYLSRLIVSYFLLLLHLTIHPLIVLLFYTFLNKT